MSDNWEAQPNEQGMLKRKCSQCGEHTFEIFKGARPIKGTIGYRVRCSNGHELTLSPRPQDRRPKKKSK